VRTNVLSFFITHIFYSSPYITTQLHMLCFASV